MATAFDGFPLGGEIFTSNTRDSQPLQAIVAAMATLPGTLGQIWTADRGAF